MNIYQKLMDEYMIKVNGSTIWDKIYGFENQYKCTLSVYFMVIVSLKLKISI